jgi:hypothetical protein
LDIYGKDSLLTRLGQLILIACFSLSTATTAAEHVNVANQSVQESFEINHSVARESFFKTMVSQSTIDGAGKTVLGKIIIRNNTRDGFTLSLSSNTSGRLAPTGDSLDRLDGEEDIPYTIQLAKEGIIGEGMDVTLTHTTSSFDTGNGTVTVLSRSGGTVSSPTDVTLELAVTVVDDANVLDMAGTYSDVLTLIYTDL